MAEELKPELKSAIVRGSIADAVLLVTGGALFYVTGEPWPLLAAIVVGSTVMVLLLAQAGAFEKR